MRVVLLEPRGMCAGVVRAIRSVELALARYGAPVYVRKQIVHNRSVVALLAERGAIFVDELSEVPRGALLLFSAHGVAPAIREEAAQRRLRVVDATCPLVAKVHRELRRAHEAGFTPVILGHAGHDEVIGTLGHAPGAVALVSSAADAATLQLPAGQRIFVLTQTTLSADDVEDLLGMLRERFSDLASARDICYATQNRQDAVKAAAPELDFLLVVGSASSSNCARLVETARRRKLPAVLVEDAAAIEPHQLDGASSVGVTSGASTPEELVREVTARLRRELGASSVEHRCFAEERVTFSLPAGLGPDDEENH